MPGDSVNHSKQRTGNNRRVLNISSCVISPEIRNAIIGLHAISGNDYVSAFFRKGKKTFWKIACKNADYLAALSIFGTTYVLDEELHVKLEKYIYAIYG